MAKNVVNKKQSSANIQSETTEVKVARRNAFRDRNWGVLFVSFMFLLSLIATLAVMFFTIGTRLDVIPAAMLMVVVELWLMASLPLYQKLTFWASVIFILSFLFFAVPFVALNILPPAFNAYAIVFMIISVACFIILFRERNLFLEQAKPPKAVPK